MRLIAMAALALSLMASAAWADGPVATADAGSGAPTPESAAPAPIQAPSADDLGPGPEVVPGPCGPREVGKDGKPDRRAHGEVDVGVGTGGYRHVRVSACKPLGDNAAIAVSVSQTQANWGRRR
jgi:hypothetical protein